MFKDLLSTNCPVSVERSMLDFETQASGSIPTRGTILLLGFLFSSSKGFDANIRIIAILVHLC